MSDLIEGVGTVAEGGLFARALEPASGALAAHPDQPANCLNCGTTLAGAYCSACGQRGHLHRTIGAFMHDLLHGALHLEGKLWHTLPMLAIRPGRLTRRYIDGERARFVSPMALFLFCVFLMFAAFQIAGISAPSDLSQFQLRPAPSVASVQESLRGERERLEREAAAAPDGSAARARAENAVADIDRTIAVVGNSPVDTPAIDASDFSLTGFESIDADLLDKWREQPELMLYKLQANAYKFSWLLIPISIPFVWLLFAWRRRFKAYDHAIFVTYSLSFMTLLFVLLSLLGMAGVPAGLLAAAVMIIPPTHLYKQLRGTYELSRFSAFWRLLALGFLMLVIIGLFLEALLLIGAF